MRVLATVEWMLAAALKWALVALVWAWLGWQLGVAAAVAAALSRLWWRPLRRGLAAAHAAVAARREFAKAWTEANCAATLGAASRRGHYRRWAGTYRRWGRGASEYLRRCTAPTANERAAFKQAWPGFAAERKAAWADFYELFYDWLVWRDLQHSRSEPGGADRFLRSQVGAAAGRGAPAEEA